MELDFKKIVKAWMVAANPSPLEKELAEKRIEICNGCEHRKVITTKLKIGVICGKCGCPLNKKVFTMKNDACPEHKWLEVEKGYFKSKTDSSII
jgi:hypothetical protein